MVPVDALALDVLDAHAFRKHSDAWRSMISKKGRSDFDLDPIDKLRIEEGGENRATAFYEYRFDAALFTEERSELLEIHPLGAALGDMPMLHPLSLKSLCRFRRRTLAGPNDDKGVRGFQNARVAWDLERARENNAKELFRRLDSVANSELGVVRADGPDAYHDSVVCRTEDVRTLVSDGRTDVGAPLVKRDFTVERLREGCSNAGSSKVHGSHQNYHNDRADTTLDEGDWGR